MCNGCGFQCCGSDLLDGCGCPCDVTACLEQCQGCGGLVAYGDCVCDDEEEW